MESSPEPKSSPSAAPPPPPPTPGIGAPETTYDPWFNRLLERIFRGKRAKNDK
jgi:hypothetical protein